MFHWGHHIFRFLFRAILGMAIIYGLNYVLSAEQISLSVGLNPISFLTCGTLGIPGVGLLYGIGIYHFL